MIRSASASLLQRGSRVVLRPASLAASLSGGGDHPLLPVGQASHYAGAGCCVSTASSSRIAASAFPGALVNPFGIQQYRNFWGRAGGKEDSGAAAGTATTTTPAEDSSSSSAAPVESVGATDSSVEDTLNKLFEEQQQQREQQIAAETTASTTTTTTTTDAASDAWYQVADSTTAASVDWTPTWYNLSDQAINMVNRMHDFLGVEYGYAIVATTLCLRFALFPLMVAAQRTTSRMAHLQPELNAIKTQYEQLGSPTRQEQQNFAKNMKALFARYEVKPSRAFLAPLIQMPIFIGMFFGLKKMPTIFPETLSDGGMFWFTDLTVPDPTYILPVVSACTFLGLIELGKEQMLMQQRGPQGAFMLNFFRAMAVMSLPVCINFEASMLVYWVTNNTLTLCQTGFLKQKPVRKYFGIWEPPKPVPGQEDPTAMASISNMIKRAQGEAVTEEQKIQQHNQMVEAKRQSIRMKRAARERRARKGITGTRN